MIESILTFLFWFYIVPVLDLVLIARLDKALRLGIGIGDKDTRYLALIPFLNLDIAVIMTILLMFSLFIEVFDLLVGE